MGKGISPIFTAGTVPVRDSRNPYGEEAYYQVSEASDILLGLSSEEGVLLAKELFTRYVCDNFYLSPNPVHSSLNIGADQVFLAVSGAPANGKDHILYRLSELLATQLHHSLYLLEPEGESAVFASQLKQGMKGKGLIDDKPDHPNNVLLSMLSTHNYLKVAEKFPWVTAKKDWKSLFTLSVLAEGEEEIFNLIKSLGLLGVFLDSSSLHRCIADSGEESLDLIYIKLVEIFMRLSQNSTLGISLLTMPIPLTFLVNRRPASTFNILDQEEQGLRENTRTSQRPFFTGWTLDKLICCRAIDTVLKDRFPHIFLEINQEDYVYPNPRDTEEWDKYWARKVATTAQNMVRAYGGNPLAISTGSTF